MTSIVYFDSNSIREIARSGEPARIKRALRCARHHAADFTTLVPWPELAASFNADALMLERALADATSAVLEPAA